LHSPAVVLDLDPPTQLPTWSRAQEPIWVCRPRLSLR